MAGQPLPATAGDGEVLTSLLGYLDQGNTSFYMHLR
jgi:hypothetical protein